MENKEIAKQDNQNTNIALNLDKKDLVRFLDMFGYKELKKEEKEQFIDICIMNRLNPFKREAHISSYGEGKFRNFSIITGYEVYVKRAETSGRLNGWNTKIEPCKTIKLHPNGTTQIISDVKAVLTIYRKDFDNPFIHEVKLSEYIGKKKDGTPTQFWLKMPETMLKKVAISQGFRLCFNEILGGMPYTREEMNIDSIDITPTEKPLPELLPDSEEWKAAVEYITNPKHKLETIEKKYYISEENRKDLIAESIDKVEQMQDEVQEIKTEVKNG